MINERPADTFTEEPDPREWMFSHCPDDETTETGCEGCSGWGLDCGAVYQAARRPDGWPICSTCGEDELYSLAVPADPAKIDGCYRCGPTRVASNSGGADVE